MRPPLRLLLAACWLLAIGMDARAATQRPAGDAPVEAWLREAEGLRSSRSWAPLDSIAARIVEHLDAQPAADSGALALALAYRGEVRLFRQMLSDSLGPACFARSLGLYGRMARPDTLKWISTLEAYSRLLYYADRGDSTLRVLAAARALCSPSLPVADSVLAVVQIATGRVHRQRQQFETAIATFESARDLRARRHGPDHPLVGEALAEIGSVYGRANRLDEAVPTLERAVAMLERQSGRPNVQLPFALAELAYAQMRAGDIGRSIETIERQVAVIVGLSGPDSPTLIPPMYNLGSRLFEFGDHAGARAIYSSLVPRADASFGPGNSRAEHVRAMAGATAMLVGDTAEAARHLETARSRLLARPMDANHMSNQIERSYSMLLARRGDLPGARRAVAGGLERERGTAHPIGSIMVQLHEQLVAAQMAGLDSAGVDSTILDMERWYEDRSRSQGDVYGYYLRVRARSEQWLGRHEQAMRFALLAEQDEREQLVRNARALPDQRALQLAAELGDGLDLLFRLSRAGGRREIETAWDRLVRWRGLVTAELAARRAPHAIASDTALAGAHERWVRALRHNARLEVAGAGTIPAQDLAASRGAVEAAERRYATLASAHGIARDTAAADLARVRAALAPGQALVSIVEVAPHTDSTRFVAFATVGPAGALHRVDLGPAREISGLLAAWRSALGTPPARGRERREERACRRLGERVRAATWDRWAARLPGARSFVLVADGDLADLPWHALPAGAEGYLVERGIEVRTPGAERELLRSAARDGSGLLALGDPDFGEAAPGGRPPMPAVVAVRAPEPAALVGTAAAGALLARSLGAGCSAPASIVLGRLPGARAEVEDIRRIWTAAHPGEAVTELVGAAGTERAFMAGAPGRSVLHLATHGILWGDSCAPVFAGTRGVGGVAPLGPGGRAKAKRPAGPDAEPPSAEPAPTATRPSPWSGRRVWLALAGANHARAGAADGSDGLLTAEEVVTLDLSDVDWVVLSACQSGLGQAWPLEGSSGMRRAFRLAGARAVIASQWPIADESTREWMRELYAARTGPEVSATRAMSIANRGVLEARRRSGRPTHPFYWAAFTAAGD